MNLELFQVLVDKSIELEEERTRRRLYVEGMLARVQIKTQTCGLVKLYNFCGDLRVAETGPESGYLTPRAVLFLPYYAGGNMAVLVLHWRADLELLTWSKSSFTLDRPEIVKPSLGPLNPMALL